MDRSHAKPRGPKYWLGSGVWTDATRKARPIVPTTHESPTKDHASALFERVDAVLHDVDTHPSRNVASIETRPAVMDLERQGISIGAEPNRGKGVARVPEHVLQRLQAAEVHAGFDGVIESGTCDRRVGLHRGVGADLADVGLDGGDDAFVREQRREDAAREVAQTFERRVGLFHQRFQFDCPCLVVAEGVERPEACADIEQLMLGTFVDVALKSFALRVARGHEALA
jgi:hypothetical protein